MKTPWGPSQTEKQLAEGVLKVSCAGHGGLLIESSMLSEAAKEFGEKCGKYTAFEEDCLWAVGAFDVNLDFHRDHQLKTISLWCPEYLVKLGREDLLLEPEYSKYKERAQLDQRRASKDPNLIVAALQIPGGAVKVWTADDNIYIIDSSGGYSPENLNLDYYEHVGPLSKFACVSEVRRVKHLPESVLRTLGVDMEKNSFVKMESNNSGEQFTFWYGKSQSNMKEICTIDTDFALELYDMFRFAPFDLIGYK